MRKVTPVDANGHPIGRKSETPSGGKSLTVASSAKGLTVNEIMKRFDSTRTIPDRGVPPQFLDASVLPSMFEELNMRKKLNDYFHSLDAVTRAKFKNNPLELVKAVNDPTQIQQHLNDGLLKLNAEGLAKKKAWDAVQAKKKADDREAFVADIRNILKTEPGSGPTNQQS